MTSAELDLTIGTNDEDLAKYRTEAVTMLNEVLSVTPRDRYQEVDMAERAIVLLRNGLIERLRREEDVDQVTRLHRGLDETNVAISLITGVEYPGAGIQEESLAQARDVLIKLGDEGIIR
jgi:hypothetical protein